MKNTKKLRYGGIAVALTALIIAVIVLFNVIFTALSLKYNWYLDMTANRIYSLTEQCLSVVQDGIAEINANREAENQKNDLSAGDEGYAKPAHVNIYFCSDPDILMADNAQRYIYETVRELADKCDFINIEYLNWRYNPSTVAKYRSAGSSINAYSVIVDADNYYTEGNNWIAYSQPKFFAADSSGNMIGYNGERVIASAILSVCSADTPIAYVATNHSEAFYDDSLLDTLSYAGYKIVTCDISDRDFEFSADGRLLVIYNPRSDASVEEIAKIDEFLDRSNSMMVFMDPNSPVLPNLEEYLETWGIVFDRVKDGEKAYSTIVNDMSNSLSSDGYTVKGEYVKANEGLASDIYKGMIENGYMPSVIFPDAMPIKLADSFAEKRFESSVDKEYDYNYGYAQLDGIEKYVYDMFTAYDSAIGVANGAEVEKTSDYKLMTMSVKKNTVGDSTGQTDPKNSYVLCAGSTKFATGEYLESAVYGNSDILLSATATIGRDIIPAVGVDFKYFQSYNISDITDAEANQYTLLLSILPPVIVFAVGAFVLIRRKYS